MKTYEPTPQDRGNCVREEHKPLNQERVNEERKITLTYV
jgi:hypothetical protein